MTLPLRVTVAPERADAAPGDNLQFDVTVRNASDIVEHYGVEMLGLPDGATVRAEPDVAKLRPAESGTLTVRVSLPVQPPAPAGTYVVGALVRSRYRHDVSRCVEVPVELAGVEQITMRATPEVVTGGRTGQYTVEVVNGGNAPVRLYLTATDPERRVQAAFRPPTVDLPPGATAHALLTVAAPLPWNREKHRALTLTAHPEHAGAAGGTSTATFVQKPRFASKFAKFAGIAAGVLVLAAAIAVPTLIAARGDDKQDPPPAAAGPAVVPPASAGAQQQQQAPASAAAPPPESAAASVAPPAAATTAAPPAATTGATTAAPPPAGGGVRVVDLTTAKDGIVAADAFRPDGFLLSADPGALAVPGCENAREVAMVTDPAGLRFLTAAAANDPTRCNQVPVMIDFLADGPAGEVTVTPATVNTLTMEARFRDLSRGDFADLKVPADVSRTHGGVDFVLLKPAVATAPVAVTKVSFGPLG